MAGGEGKRLKSVTGPIPKPMVPLIGKPLMERILELLRAAGITEICAALGYNPEPIVAHFGDGSRFGVHLEYRLEKTPLGTAGGVKNCADFYGKEDFIVLSGDAACDFDLRRLAAEHRTAHAAVTMALYETPDPLSYGLVVPEPGGTVRCFIEKPGWDRVVTNLVNTGIYVLSPEAMALVPENTPYDFARNLFPLLIEKGLGIHGAAMDGYWCDIGTPHAYFQCCLDALDGRLRLPDVVTIPEPSVPAQERVSLAGSMRSRRLIPCRDRARLMRAVSECMMAFGAEFSDGVLLRGGHCGLRVFPAAESSAVTVEAASGDAEFSKELALTMGNLAESLERTVSSPPPGAALHEN
jgi:mannose-1-phosphate guanylyltransferase/phosphomannomutase